MNLKGMLLTLAVVGYVPFSIWLWSRGARMERRLRKYDFEHRGAAGVGFATFEDSGGHARQWRQAKQA